MGGMNSGSGGVLQLSIEIPELASICSRGGGILSQLVNRMQRMLRSRVKPVVEKS